MKKLKEIHQWLKDTNTYWWVLNITVGFAIGQLLYTGAYKTGYNRGLLRGGLAGYDIALKDVDSVIKKITIDSTKMSRVKIETVYDTTYYTLSNKNLKR